MPVLALALGAAVCAQPVYYSARPALMNTEDWTVGARWEAGVEPTQRAVLASSFPREFSFRMDGRGAVAARAAWNPEPLVDAKAEAGLQVLLLSQHPCLPNDCPEDLVRFNAGYVTVGARGAVQFDQLFDEGVASIGGSFGYRPLGLQHGLWPLVPSVGIAYMADKPLASTLRDTLDVGNEPYGRFDLEVIWHVLMGWDWVPSGLHPARLDVVIAHYRTVGTDEQVEAVAGRKGTFVSVDLGYELTGQVPWIRQVFLRWSRGEHVVRPRSEETWMLGVVLGATR
jgi:hypothetical protein